MNAISKTKKNDEKKENNNDKVENKMTFMKSDKDKGKKITYLKIMRSFLFTRRFIRARIKS